MTVVGADIHKLVIIVFQALVICITRADPTRDKTLALSDYLRQWCSRPLESYVQEVKDVVAERLKHGLKSTVNTTKPQERPKQVMNDMLKNICVKPTNDLYSHTNRNIRTLLYQLPDRCGDI